MTSPGAPDYLRGKLLHRGAEADIVRGKWLGLEAIFKIRRAMPYRLPTLDLEIRSSRTSREADTMTHARGSGVSTPRVYFVDRVGTSLAMEYVGGTRLREFSLLSPVSKVVQVFRTMGRDVARMHLSNIIHGDLTTANVMVRDHDLVFLDFGLAFYSSRIEDRAVDLRLVKEIVHGAHSEIAEKAMASLMKGYHDEVGPTDAGAVFGQLKRIEQRGRYARVV